MKNRFTQKIVLLTLITVFSFVSISQARTSYRSAKTGRYVTKTYSSSHPATTYRSRR